MTHAPPFQAALENYRIGNLISVRLIGNLLLGAAAGRAVTAD